MEYVVEGGSGRCPLSSAQFVVQEEKNEEEEEEEEAAAASGGPKHVESVQMRSFTSQLVITTTYHHTPRPKSPGLERDKGKNQGLEEEEEGEGRGGVEG